jgi:hypothetical protein
VAIEEERVRGEMDRIATEDMSAPARERYRELAGQLAELKRARTGRSSAQEPQNKHAPTR